MLVCALSLMLCFHAVPCEYGLSPTSPACCLGILMMNNEGTNRPLHHFCKVDPLLLYVSCYVFWQATTGLKAAPGMEFLCPSLLWGIMIHYTLTCVFRDMCFLWNLRMHCNLHEIPGAENMSVTTWCQLCEGAVWCSLPLKDKDKVTCYREFALSGTKSEEFQYYLIYPDIYVYVLKELVIETDYCKLAMLCYLVF